MELFTTIALIIITLTLISLDVRAKKQIVNQDRILKKMDILIEHFQKDRKKNDE